MMTGPKKQIFQQEEAKQMSGDHTDKPKQRFSCDAGKANESAAS